ncbi:helix-turn-helix domain-containing protein [Acidaminobacter sp.]|uniref:helix-turn-helix domain-containing protein n=1 Tax=Acidaminobacter sp. TaxID=1872102 RepID=UPI00137E6CA6|nr:helix-turn-helix domain-containing protein [Acidaminobacter sp.]MDK9710766.1 helix-turn-helix domain-containing protein [Acidaminobacter sp.]MZQ96711.1 helix-turn-helix domain-containing protein [Acidaminobacter sp.]
MHLRSFFSNRLFIKMLMYFSTLLIPVLLIGILFYNYSVSEAKKDFSQNITKNLEFSMELIDHSVQMAVDASLNLMMEDAFFEPVMSSPEMSTEQKRHFESMIQAIVKSQNISNYFIDNLFVFRDSEWVFRSAGPETFDRFFRELYWFEKYPVPFWKTYLTRPSAVQYLSPTLIKTSSGSTKTVIPTVAVEHSPKGNIAVVACLSTSAIHETIRSNMIYPETEFILLDTADNIITSSRDDLWNSDAVERLKSLSAAGPSELIPLEWQGENYLVSALSSERLEWTYYTITPSYYFRAEANNVLSVTFWTSIAIILLGIGLALIFSVRLYSPINNIREILMQNGGSEGTGGPAPKHQNEFELIQSALHELLSEKTAYSDKVHELSSEYLDNAFIQLLRGHSLDPIKKFRTLIRDDLRFTTETFLCFSVVFDFNERFFTKIESQERHHVLESIKIIILDALAAQNRVYLLELEPGHFVGIANLDTHQDQVTLMKSLEQLLLSFSYELKHYRIYIGVGRIHGGLNKLWLSYSEAQYALEAATGSAQNQVADASTLEIKPHHIYTFKDEEKIMNCLQARDEAGLESILDGLVRQTETIGSTGFSRQALFHDLHRTAARYAAAHGLDFYTALDQQVWSWTTQTHGAEVEPGINPDKAVLLQMFKSLMALAEPPSDRSAQMIQNVVTFIDDHFHEDIHPELIASQAGISVKYLSKLFKSQTNQNLTDYISQKRIFKAKALLNTTTLSIDDIYPMVGLQSRVTFYRLFKKHVGTNPGSYRKGTDQDLDQGQEADADENE